MWSFRDRGVVMPMRRPVDWLSRIGGLIVLAACVAVFVGLGPSISDWLQIGTLLAAATLVWSLRHLHDDEHGDRALVLSLLGVATLGAVLWITVSSLHSWRWIGGVVGALAIPLVVKGFFWLVDNVGDRNRFEGDAWRDRPRY